MWLTLPTPPSGASVNVVDPAAAQPLGPRYSAADLGRPAHAGPTLVRRTAAALPITGGCQDIQGQADYGHYVSKPRTVDVDMSVRVGTFAGVVNGRAKAGTMFWTDDGGGGLSPTLWHADGQQGRDNDHPAVQGRALQPHRRELPDASPPEVLLAVARQARDPGDLLAQERCEGGLDRVNSSTVTQND